MSAAGGTTAPRETDTGWYLYGVVAAETGPGELGPSPPVDPRHGVELLAEGPVAGVTSRVSLDEFAQAALTERLADAAWLEEKIRAHEQMLEVVLSGAAVVPCRFCTVFRSEVDVRRFLSERSGVLAEALARVEGGVELGVKAFLDRDRFAKGGALRNDTVRELSERTAHAEGGRAYLERRRLEQLVNDELSRFTDEVGGALDAHLLAAAEEGVLLALQRPEASGREEAMLFNGAYLVRDRVRFERELASLAEGYRGDGVELELTGPWPPYNFVPRELGES